MLGPLLLGLLVAIDPRASRVDVSGGAAIEVRGGVAPLTQDGEPVPSFLGILTPNVDLEVRSRRGGTYSFGYAPRMQYRLPNRLDVERPIFLHQLYAIGAIDWSRRWSSVLQANTSVGELDYTGVVFAFGGAQAGTFEVNVAQFALATAELGVQGRVAPTQTLHIVPRFEVRTPIGSTLEAANRGDFNLPTQLIGNLALGYEVDATSTDAVDVFVTPGVVDYNDETTFASGEGRVGWERQLRPALSSRADLGVFGARTLRVAGMAEAQVGDVKVFPVGSFRLTGRLYGRSAHRLEGTLGGGAQGFFDRISQRVEPRGNLSAGLTTIVPPRWSAGVSASAFTALTADPRPRVGPMMNFRTPETVIAGATPVTYTISDEAQVEFGTVVSLRGSHLADPDFAFTQLEGWFYVAFRIAAGTARGGEEVGERASGPIGVGARGFGVTPGR